VVSGGTGGADCPFQLGQRTVTRKVKKKNQWVTPSTARRRNGYGVTQEKKEGQQSSAISGQNEIHAVRAETKGKDETIQNKISSS